MINDTPKSEWKTINQCLNALKWPLNNVIKNYHIRE